MEYKNSQKITEKEEWIKQMIDLSNSFNSDIVDMNDERIRHILKTEMDFS